MEMKKRGMLGRRDNIIKDTEIEEPHAYMDGGIYLICLGYQVERRG